MRRTLLAILLLFSPIPIFADNQANTKPDVRYISVSGTRLLSRHSAFSKTIDRLDAGTQVTVIKKYGSYLKVKTSDSQGWIAARSVQTKKPKIGYSDKKTSDTSSEEVAAATKGFNSDVEGQYKKDNPKLDYDGLDKIEARTTVADPVKDLADFREKGKLGEFSKEKEDDNDE